MQIDNIQQHSGIIIKYIYVYVEMYLIYEGLTKKIQFM